MRKKALRGLLLAVTALLGAWGCRSEHEGGKVLTGKEEQLVREKLGGLSGNVELVSFTAEGNRGGYRVARMGDEIAVLQAKVVHQRRDFNMDADAARAYNIRGVPALVIKKAKDYRLRFYGYPGGYEFPVVIDTIARLDRGKPNLSASGTAALAALRVPVSIKIFVTPS